MNEAAIELVVASWGVVDFAVATFEFADMDVANTDADTVGDAAADTDVGLKSVAGGSIFVSKVMLLLDLFVIGALKN